MTAVAAIGSVTAYEGNLFWLHPAVSACPSSSGGDNTPLGTWFAFSKPTEQVAGTNHWYNFSVQSSEPSIVMADLTFQVQADNGSEVTPGVGWVLVVVTADLSTRLATYEFAGGNWTSDGQGSVSTEQVVSLDTGPTNLSAMGSTFYVVVNGGCAQGSVSVSIP